MSQLFASTNCIIDVISWTSTGPLDIVGLCLAAGRMREGQSV